MKKISAFFLIIGLMLSLFIPASAKVREQDQSIAMGCHSLDAEHPLLGDENLVPNAASMALFDRDSETMIYGWNVDEPLPPASLVKIMTAWVAIENGNLNDSVTVDTDILKNMPKDASAISLQDGEIITLKDLIYSMMVGSANDSAMIIADYVGGSQKKFVAMMNEYAYNAGCTDTNFMNPTGFDDPQQYTTARDMLRILMAALENETFADVLCSDYYVVEKTNLYSIRYISSNNFLMNTTNMEIYYDDRVTGGRTGLTALNLRNVAATAEEGNMRVISVVLGAADVYDEQGYAIRSFGGFPETTALLDLGLSGYRRAQVVYDGQLYKRVPVLNGDGDVLLGAHEALATVLPDGIEMKDLTLKYFDDYMELQAPVKKGDRLSRVQLWYKGVCIAETDLYAMNEVAVKENMRLAPGSGKNGPSFRDIMPKLLVIGGIGVVGFLVVNRIRNQVRLANDRKRSRMNRMNRRRSR